MQIKLTDRIREAICDDIDRRFYASENFITLLLGRTEINYQYYNGDLPLPIFEGGSDFKDRTCHTTVRGVLDDLLNCFTTGDPVKFAATDSTDFDSAKLATDLVNQIILRDNRGQQALESAFKESLIAGTSFIKRYWTEEKTIETSQQKGLTDEKALAGYLAGLKAAGIDLDSNEASVEVTPDEQTGSFDVTITYPLERKYVRLEHTPLEEIRFDEQTQSLDDCNYFCHLTRVTKDVIKQLGYPEDKIDELDDYFLNTSEDVTLSYTRGQYRQDQFQDVEIDSDNLAFRVRLKEHYFRTDKIANDGTLHLYKVFQAGEEYFGLEETHEIPFTNFCPMPIEASLIGESAVELVKDVQDIRAQLKRLIMDHVATTSYPKYTIIEGAVDKRDLMSLRRPGAIVRINNPTAINLLPQEQLPAEISYLMQLTEDDAEKRTGVSRTAQGLNPEIAARTGSESVSMILSAATKKLKSVCRTIANNGVKELMLAVYNIYRENAELPLSVLTVNGVAQVNPKDLPSRIHIEIAVALSPQEKEDRANKFERMINGLIQMQQLQGNPFITPPQFHYITQGYIESLGFKDSNNYLIPMEQFNPPQPQPDPVAEAQAQLLQAQANKLLNDAHVDTERLQFEQQKAADDMDHKQQLIILEQQKAADQTNLGVAKLNVQREIEGIKAAHNQDKNAIHREELTVKSIKDQSEIMLASREQTLKANQQKDNAPY